MKKTLKVVSRIDYPLLREQKISLLNHIRKHKGEFSSDHFDGLVCMIDEIQDAVIEDGIKTKEEVFG